MYEKSIIVVFSFDTFMIKSFVWGTIQKDNKWTNKWEYLWRIMCCGML